MWTPWQTVNIDIQADHLVPVVWERRLYLFWPSFQQTSDPSNQSTTLPGTNAQHFVGYAVVCSHATLARSLDLDQLERVPARRMVVEANLAGVCLA